MYSAVIYTTHNTVYHFFPCNILAQYEIILILMSIIKGYNPNSPYIMEEGVVFFNPSKSLQNFNCTLSITSVLLKPQTSDP